MGLGPGAPGALPNPHTSSWPLMLSRRVQGSGLSEGVHLSNPHGGGGAQALRFSAHGAVSIRGREVGP